MITLFFDINGSFRKYTVKEFKIIDGFYFFTDVRDGISRKLSKEYYRGEEKKEAIK